MYIKMFLAQFYSKVNLPILDAICSRAEFTKLSDKNNAIKEMKINLSLNFFTFFIIMKIKLSYEIL